MSYMTTRVMGTFGYVAPEYACSGMLTEKSGVYSFGIFIMELIAGRTPVDYSRPPGEERRVRRDSSTSSRDYPQEKPVAAASAKVDAIHFREASMDMSKHESSKDKHYCCSEIVLYIGTICLVSLFHVKSI